MGCHAAQSETSSVSRGMRAIGVPAWNIGWFVLGAALAFANTIRHRLLGYTTPRPFGQDDLGRTIDHVLAVVDRWQRSGLEPRNRRILELGPGPDLGTGFVLVALGAASYTALDRFALATSDSSELYAALAERLGVSVSATQQHMQYLVGEMAMSAELGRTFDAFVSNAALEHISDIPGTFAFMESLASHAPIHVHMVDAQTHMRWVRPRDPWNILRYPGWIYRLMTFPGAPNRLLASDYVAAARETGLNLSVLAVDRTDDDYLRRVRPFLARPFRNRTDRDLGLLTFTLVSSAVPRAGERRDH
jgi:hypothetical protein